MGGPSAETTGSLIVNMAAFLNHVLCKSLQGLFVLNIAHEPAAGLKVNDVHNCAFAEKSVRDRSADPVAEAC